MKRFVGQVAVCASSAAVCVAVAALAGMQAERLPQVAKGGGALSVAFADAKAAISSAMLQKADSYFHGGIDIECHEGCEHDHEGEHGHGGDEGHRGGAWDPWRWINLHVRAPERHVHLDGDKAVELLPWFWAAVRADPHNVDAWTTAAYAADRMIGDRSLARRVLREARARNPCSLDIALAEARMVYDGGSGDVAAAERLFEEARAAGKRLCGGRLAALSAHDAEMYCDILDYLSKIYESRGERAAIHALADEARATGAATPAVKAVESREQER